jgi:hypothetical protein
MYAVNSLIAFYEIHRRKGEMLFLSRKHTRLNKIKIYRYYELTNALIRSYTVSFYAVEVRARTIPAKTLYNFLKDLGKPRGAINSALERVSKAALLDPYRIW